MCWTSGGGGGDTSYIAHTKNHIVSELSESKLRSERLKIL